MTPSVGPCADVNSFGTFHSLEGEKAIQLWWAVSNTFQSTIFFESREAYQQQNEYCCCCEICSKKSYTIPKNERTHCCYCIPLHCCLCHFKLFFKRGFKQINITQFVVRTLSVAMVAFLGGLVHSKEVSFEFNWLLFEGRHYSRTKTFLQYSERIFLFQISITNIWKYKKCFWSLQSLFFTDI